MKMEPLQRKTTAITVFLLFIIVASVSPAIAGQHQTPSLSQTSFPILIFYDTEDAATLALEVKSSIESLQYPINVTLIEIDQFESTSYNFLEARGIIVLHEKEDELPPEFISFIAASASRGDNFILFSSASLTGFSSLFLSYLGIQSIGRQYPASDSEYANWNLIPEHVQSNITNTSFYGRVQELTFGENATILWNATYVSGIQGGEPLPSEPLPVIVNTTKSSGAAVVIASLFPDVAKENRKENNLSLIHSASQELKLNRPEQSVAFNRPPRLEQSFPVYVSLLSELFTLIGSKIINETLAIDQNNTENTDTAGNQEKDDNIIPMENITIPPVNLQYLLAVLLALLLLAILKLSNFLAWLQKRMHYAYIAIAGAISQKYYHTSERVLDPSEVLQNPLRYQLFEFIRSKQSFGAHVRELKNSFGLGSGALLWHLQVLEDFKYVKRINIGGYVVFIDSTYLSEFDPKAKLLELSLRTENGKRILDVLLSNPYKTWNVSKLSKQANVNRKTTRKLLRTLVELSALEYDDTNGNRGQGTYVLTSHGLELLRKIKELSRIRPQVVEEN